MLKRLPIIHGLLSIMSGTEVRMEYPKPNPCIHIHNLLTEGAALCSAEWNVAADVWEIDIYTEQSYKT